MLSAMHCDAKAVKYFGVVLTGGLRGHAHKTLQAWATTSCGEHGMGTGLRADADLQHQRSNGGLGEGDSAPQGMIELQRFRPPLNEFIGDDPADVLRVMAPPRRRTSGRVYAKDKEKFCNTSTITTVMHISQPHPHSWL